MYRIKINVTCISDTFGYRIFLFYDSFVNSGENPRDIHRIFISYSH
jgi:hypothetical protein